VNPVFQTQVGFASISLPGVAGQFQQLPNIPCDRIAFGKTSADIRLAGSASPGGAYVALNTSAGGQSSTSEQGIATGGNSGNLFIANDSATAQTVGFFWVLESVKAVYWAC
jgi:hypothetical protein